LRYLIQAALRLSPAEGPCFDNLTTRSDLVSKVLPKALRATVLRRLEYDRASTSLSEASNFIRDAVFLVAARPDAVTDELLDALPLVLEVVFFSVYYKMHSSSHFLNLT
jgi:hypothetical protein